MTPSASKIQKRGPFTIQSTKEIYSNPWLSLREDQAVRPDGKAGIFGVVTMKAGSTVLALDSNLNAYVTKEYKYAIEQESIELVSGGIEHEESPLEAAQRELREELGLISNNWVDLGMINPFTTIINSPNYLFLAIDVTKAENSKNNEDILEMISIPFVQLNEMAIRGEITHGASCVTILKAERYLRNNKYII